MSEVVIGKRTYKLKIVLATKTVFLQARLLKVVGPGMTELIDLLQGNVDEMMQAKVALNGLSKVFCNCDPQGVTDLIRDLVELCDVMRENGSYGDGDYGL